MQVLEGGNLKPLAEHMNGQQFTWLQALEAGKPPEVRAAEAPPLAAFLAGGSQQGYKYSPAFYGCLAPYLPVGVSLAKPAINVALISRRQCRCTMVYSWHPCAPMTWRQLLCEAVIHMHNNVIGVWIALSVAGHDCRGAEANHSASDRVHHLPP
jgi:hypothetical protein